MSQFKVGDVWKHKAAGPWKIIKQIDQHIFMISSLQDDTKEISYTFKGFEHFWTKVSSGNVEEYV